MARRSTSFLCLALGTSDTVSLVPNASRRCHDEDDDGGGGDDGSGGSDGCDGNGDDGDIDKYLRANESSTRSLRCPDA